MSTVLKVNRQFTIKRQVNQEFCVYKTFTHNKKNLQEIKKLTTNLQK